MEWLFPGKGGLMWLQCVPWDSFCRSRSCEPCSCPSNTFTHRCIWDKSGGLCNGTESRAPMQINAINKLSHFILILRSNAHSCAHSPPRIYSQLTCTTTPITLKKGKAPGGMRGRGSGRDITSPLHTIAVMCGEGQRQIGGWDKGSKGWRCRGGVVKEELEGCSRRQRIGVWRCIAKDRDRWRAFALRFFSRFLFFFMWLRAT